MTQNKKPLLTIDYESVEGSAGTIELYRCRHCNYETITKSSLLSPLRTKRDILNHLRGVIITHVKNEHPYRGKKL